MKIRHTMAALLLCASPLATATPIYDNFGSLPEATFGGSGIPNDAVAASRTFVDGDTEITVALTAHQRYSNPVVTNDGAGTFFATPGSNFGNPGGPPASGNEGATWNFAYFIKVEGLNGNSPTLSDYQFDLFYDFDEGQDTPLNQLGKWNLTATDAYYGGPTSLNESSQNLMFAFLDTPTAGFITPPPGEDFDPDELGEYTFAIQVSSLSGFGAETVAIDVAVIPEPAAGLLLAGLPTLGRRRRSNA